MPLVQSKKNQREVEAVGEIRYLTVQSDYHRISIPVNDIMYVTIDGRKTKISKKDGTCVRTNKSLKDVYADLPADVFSSINRGIVVSKNFIKSEKDGVLTMKDGTQFKRRVRSDRLRERPGVVPAGQESQWRQCPTEELDWWLGAMPAPVCILEMVYRSRGGSAAVVVRYCNRAMEQLEGIALRDVRDQPVTLMKHVGNPKWLTIFADVAINGGTKVIDELWEDTGKFLRVHCYQPQSGCCALVLTDLTRENNLIQQLIHRGTRI